jgi:adenylate cyclase
VSGAGDTSRNAEQAAEALARLGERNLTWPVLCERAGVDHEIADPLWRALGFPDVAPDEPAYSGEDVRALRIAAEGLERLEGAERKRALELIVREARTMSGHLARIAEQQVDLLPQLEAIGLWRRSVAEALEHGIERSPLGWLIVYALRRRLDEAITRRGATESGPEPELVVGFVDLVDFTRASTGLDAATFGRVLGRFEALAWDEVTEAGGRLVKLIGDEAMVVFPPDTGAAEATLAILGQCGRDELPRARAGLAAGPVLIRGGDYFGPVVNLASRLVDAARAGTTIVDTAYRQILEELGPELSLAQLEPRDLKGIGSTEIWQVAADGLVPPIV